MYVLFKFILNLKIQNDLSKHKKIMLCLILVEFYIDFSLDQTVGIYYITLGSLFLFFKNVNKYTAKERITLCFWFICL